VGVGIVWKVSGARITRAHCVRIYVEHKVPRKSLSENLLLPEHIGSIMTDVIETGRFRALLPSIPIGQTRLRPAKPGCSIGFQFTDLRAGGLMAGTLGALLEVE